MKSLPLLIILLGFGSGFYREGDRPPDRGEGRHFRQEVRYAVITSSTP
ncbi:hypothetical protein QUA83_28090 [Microcoleus sp. K1-B1]